MDGIIYAQVHLTFSISGDGDWRHIGYKVACPGAFEIASVCAVLFTIIVILFVH